MPTSAALAHVEGAPALNLWSSWSFDPFAIIPLVLFGLLFARGALQLLSRSRRARAPLIGRIALFAAGYALLVSALVWPLDAMGEWLFAAHMAQHMVLMVAAAPLLVLARPLPALLLSLPAPARRALVGGWARLRLLPASWRVISSPAVAALLQLAVLFAWHAPFLFRAASASEPVHAAMHASFLFSALLFWWSILAASAAGGKQAAIAVFCLVLTLKLSGVLGLAFAVLARPVYPDLFAATALWGLSTAEDQQLAGIIMLASGLPVYMGAALAVLGLWLARMEAASRPAHTAAKLTTPRVELG